MAQQIRIGFLGTWKKKAIQPSGLKKTEGFEEEKIGPPNKSQDGVGEWKELPSLDATNSTNCIKTREEVVELLACPNLHLKDEALEIHLEKRRDSLQMPSNLLNRASSFPMALPMCNLDFGADCIKI